MAGGLVIGAGRVVPLSIAAQARALADAEDDPISAFLYDLDALASHAAALKASLPPAVELYYAIKANSEAPILAAIAPHVDGFEISSGGEIARLAAAGMRKPFVFSGPGKLTSELAAARAAGVEAVHVESLAEIGRVAALARPGDPPQPVLLRINPDLPPAISSRLVMAGGPSPFGIDEAALPEAVERIAATPGLRLVGFHVHAMSHQQDAGRHAVLVGHYLERWAAWRGLARHPETIVQLNVGGGIGVDYVGGTLFDWPWFCDQLATLLASMPHPPRLRFEIGRFLSAYCGYYVMEIIDVKDSRGQRFAVCRGGTHQFRLPAAQGHDHPVIHFPAHGRRGGRAEPAPVTVVGQLCTPKDVLARGVLLVAPRPGDLLILPLAGAYGYNISHTDFLCHPQPRQLFVRQDDAANGPTIPRRPTDATELECVPAGPAGRAGVERALLSAAAAAGDPAGIGAERDRHGRPRIS